MDDSDFGDPENQAFPIKTAQDVINAASRLHNSKGDQSAIKARIKRIAKRKGFPLPQTWQDEEDESKDRVMTELQRAKSADGTDSVEIDADGSHGKMKGSHSHKHNAFQRADGSMHSHLHDHDDDNDHDHTHVDDSSDAKERSITSESLSVYLPITRVDATARTVTGQATIEKPDAYGTIFGYYPDAWINWRGNMREQHDPRKAVGKAIEVIPDEQERAIYVTSKVSRGAQDTWLKIEDGVLTGYSASIIPDAEFGNDPKKWPKKVYEGKEYPYLPRYTVAETSYVDNPATPGCNITVVRADGFITEVIDVEEEENQTLERAGARVSGATKTANHQSIGHTLRAAATQMKNCNCDNCQAALRMIDPDNDNDIDLGGYDDPDQDWQSLYKDGDDMERVVTTLIERAVQPVYMRLQSIAGSFAKSSIGNVDQIVEGSIQRAVAVLEKKFADLATISDIDKVQAELSAVKDRVEKIAEQPVPGGPVLNASSVEKRLPTDPPLSNSKLSYGAVYDAISQMARQGSLDTQDKQVDAMTAGLIAQRRR